MAFKASLSVLLGCQFGAANKLLQAAEKGNSNEVSEILCSKPQLAAYTGFNNSFSPLHRAAAGGYVDVCRSIIEPIKQRVKVAEAAVASGRKKISLLKKWQGLLTTVLNQRTSRSMTALMLACENGHAAVAAYLLREGADPLACDWVHMRNCMHYAAMGGQVDCLRLLCSVNTQVQAKDGYRALKDVVVQDIQVETCRFIDQRAFGGLTALHFAVVTGNLEAVQALLRGGASIMVKTDGEAYIGDEYLVPGSSPLHIAVIIGNISIVHAILQAHMENMNVVGQGLDERGRRPWEGSSRTDIRSVRNSFRKLPFHLARERGLQQLMSLVDPRIPIDVALDAARDTEHGIGPKRLSTIVSLVLQQSLLHWLDDCQDEIAKEATGHEGMRVHGTTRTPSLTSLDVPTAAVLAAAASLPLGGLPLAPGLPPAPAAGPASITVAKASRSSQNESGTQHQQPSKRPPLPRGTHRQSQSRESTPPGRASSLPPPAPPRAVEPPAYPIPAEHSLEMMPARHSPGGSSGDSPRTPDGAQALGTAAGAVPVPIGQPLGRRVPADMLRGSASTPASPFGLLCGAPVSDPACPYISQSAPVSPATGFAALAGEGTPGGPASQRLPLTASVPGLLQLHSAQEEGSGALHGGDPSGLTRMNSLHAYMGMLSVKRSRTVSLDPPSTHFPHGRVPTLRNGQPVLRTTEGQALATSRRQSLHRQQSLPVNLGVPANVGSANSSFTRADNSLTEEVHDRTVTVVSGKRSIQSTPTIRGMLTSIRERLRSSESIPVPLPASLLEEKDKDLASEPEPPSPTKSDDSEGDVECGICLDHVVEVAFSGCEHSLCLDCARNLTKQDKKPPHCPFCRRMVVGFMRVSPTRHPVQMR